MMNLRTSYKPEHRRVICEFIRTKVEDAGALGVVLGLSGGLDPRAAAVSGAMGICKV